MAKKPYHKHKVCKYGGCNNWIPGELRCGYETKGHLQKRLKSLHKKAWGLRSEVVRRSAKGVCFTCGDQRPWKEQNAGHMIHGNEYDFVDFVIQCQCVRCNMNEGEGAIFAEKFIRIYGQAEFDRIKALKNNVVKMSATDYNVLITVYKAQLKELDEMGL